MAARDRLLILPILSLLLGGGVGAARAAASSPDSPAIACGHRLSPPVLAEWNALGGAKGDLGCPTEDESPGSTSPQGSRADEADFPRGMIVWHASGPRTGQTYAITGCIWRLYFQFGGPSGWLGLPIAEQENFPDGQRQSFEGGRITYERATDSCDAEHTSEIAAAAPSPPAAEATPLATSPLDSFLDPARGDHLSAASTSVADTALAAHYQRIGAQARVLVVGGGGTAPLKLFWNDTKGDHVITATDEGERDAFAAGYEFEASQGFVWTGPHPGSIALKQYADPASGHHWLIASADEEAQAKAAGFHFVRIEGYAPTP
ncbi:MAG TPA: hypothetical protein VG227_04280 [Caulobacteraceae bacterium]|jgi:hypothetical protein|nr:hypothetical protein [Caulobacteraceae bacterium]